MICSKPLSVRACSCGTWTLQLRGSGRRTSRLGTQRGSFKDGTCSFSAESLSSTSVLLRLTLQHLHPCTKGEGSKTNKRRRYNGSLGPSQGCTLSLTDQDSSTLGVRKAAEKAKARKDASSY